MTTATLTHTLTDSLPRIDTAFLRTAAAVIAATATSAFVLSILASVQAGL